MTKPIHRDDVRRLGIGAVTVAVGAVVAWIGITVQGGGPIPLKSYTTVSAAFEDVGTLKPQQKVTENGVRIGMITGIDYVDGAALVTMRLEGDHEVYQDATAQIGNESALGKKYVDLDPGTPAAGDLGDDVLPADQTTDAADLDTVLQTFDPQARNGLSDTLRAVGGGFIGHGPDLKALAGRSPELLTDADVAVGTLAAPTTNLDDLLIQADTLAGEFQGSEEELAALLDQAATTLEAVNVDETAPLHATLERLPQTLRTAREGLAAVNEPLRTTARAAVRLRPGVDRLVEATPDLRGFLTESPPVARTVQTFTDQAEPALKALVPTVEDLRPLVVDRVTRALSVADPFLTEMAPWWADARRLGAQHNMLSGHFSPTKHYFSAMLALPGLYNASIYDPLAAVDPYSGPGNAINED
jgi:phospholipid/cholesterol/gamma-HCH transport system substrate-binding protein